ncbi:MAG: glycosyltransferase family 4 protein [Verrucomicrobiota bacterium]
MTNSANKSLLWVDAHMEFRSPSVQHLLHSLPSIREAGWEIEIWCLRSDAPRDAARHVFIPAPKWLGPFELLYFSLAVNLYGLWRKFFGRPMRFTVIHATCGTYLGANLTSVHFVSSLWAKKQIELGFDTWKEVARFLLGFGGVVFERLTWWSPSIKKILCVSDSIAREIKERAPAGVPVETFPNSYDETRFNPDVRERYRQAVRTELGLQPCDTAFVFVSQGHYKRKGLWLAVEALARLRQERLSHLRLLVVGGSAATLDSLRLQLAVRAADWKKWVLLLGMQPQVEKYYAAADAFLFPSYFEAFSLAEIEAAACGLPLLLTPHHGAEMILRDGINGMELSFDPREMSCQLRRRGRPQRECARLPPFAPGAGRGLNRAQYARQLLETYEAFVSA